MPGTPALSIVTVVVRVEGPTRLDVTLLNGEEQGRRQRSEDVEDSPLAAPADAARAHTCEEDLLTELIGRRKRPARTERRWKRVDLSLHATLPYGSTTSMPEPRVFGAWTASIEEKIHAAFREIEERNGRIVAVLGGHGDLEVQVPSKPDGVASLNGVGEIEGLFTA